MNTPLHPLVVHFPIVFAVLMPLLGGALLFALARNWVSKRTWALVTLGHLVLLGSGFLALRSGEADAHVVEKRIPEAVIEAHEEAGEAFVLGSAATLVLAVVPLVLRNRRLAHWMAAATVAGSLVVLGLGVRVGKLGGELVYQHGAGSAFTKAASLAGPGAPRISNLGKESHDHDR